MSYLADSLRKGNPTTGQYRLKRMPAFYQVLLLLMFIMCATNTHAALNQEIDISNGNACQVSGGTLVGANIFTAADNGTFGTGSGAANEFHATNIYASEVSGGTYRNSYASYDHGSFSFVSNQVTRRNSSQFNGTQIDPVYGESGMFMVSDPSNVSPTLDLQLTGLVPGSSYEVSFWVADTERKSTNETSTKNRIAFDVDGTQQYITPYINSNGNNDANNPVIWYKHSYVYTHANASSTVDASVRIAETAAAGRDIFLDNIEIRACQIPANLVTTKVLSSGSSATPDVGDTVSFDISITNNGPGVAMGVSLTDLLPAGLTIAAGNGVIIGETNSPGGTYNQGTGLWDVGAVGLNETVTLTLVGTVDSDQAGQSITNTLSAPATGTETDPTTAGDDLTETVTVNAAPVSCTNNLLTGEFGGTFGTTNTQRDLQSPVSGYTYTVGQNGGYPAATYTVISNVLGTSYWHSIGQLTIGTTTGTADDAYLLVNGSTAVGTFYQETIAVAPNVSLDVSVNARNWAHPYYDNPGERPDIALRVYAANGTTLLGQSSTGSIAGADGWVQVQNTVNTGANSQVVVKLQNLSTQSAGNDFVIDDFSVKATSAPCTFASYDYGDAPTSGTSPNGSGSNAYSDASHTLVSGIYLGASDADADSGTQASPNADGDDSDGTDDEDGITIPVMTEGLTSTVTATVSGAGGYLQGWIDFDGNGSFDPDEQVATNLQDGGSLDTDSATGTISFEVNVPASATYRKTYARFRWSTDAGLNSTTVANDGEVEDYALFIKKGPASFACSATVDVWYANDESGSVNATEFTQARDFIYQVTDGFYHSAINGAQGGLVGWAFGATPINVVIPITEDFYDQDDSGIATTGTTVDGDGLGVRENYIAKVDNTGGTQLANATQGLANLINAGNGRRTGVPQVAVILTDAPYYQINNVSYNGGGTAWEAAAANLRAAGPDGTRIVLVLLAEAAEAYDNNAASKATIDSVIGSTGTLVQTDNYAAVADPANIYITNTTTSICDAATLPITDDYSDAPANGSTAPNGTGTTAYGEATHSIVDELQLGSTTDSENASIASPLANGDGTDDDGIAVLPVLTPDSNKYQVEVTASNTTGNPGRLLAWIDFDGNGRFDADEAAARVIPTGTTNASFSVIWANIPSDIQAGNTFLRLRLTTDSLNSAMPSGAKPDGEVEDYALTIGGPGAGVSGRVYVDANSNASEDAGESGIRGTVVVLRETTTGVCRSVITDADGDYRFTASVNGNYQIYQAHGETTPVPQSCGSASANNPTGYQSTTPDILTVTVAGADVTDQDFGEVAGTNSTTTGNAGIGILFTPNHQSAVLPGNVVFYAHEFSSEAEGALRFTTGGSNNTATGWSHQIYRDSDCNGVLDGIEANTPIENMNFGVAAGSQLCIIDKVYAPSNVSAQDSYRVDIAATFSYAGGSPTPLVLNVMDITTASQTATSTAGESRLVLRKTVENLTQSTAETETVNQAVPGDLLRYRIYYRNAGSGPITDLMVNDTLPPLTGFVSGTNSCDVTPTALTCTSTQNLESLEWVFSGTLVSGAQGSVGYQVVIDN